MFGTSILRPSTGFNKSTNIIFFGYLVPWRWIQKTPAKLQKLLVFNNYYCVMSQNTLIFINAALMIPNFSTCRNISYKNYYMLLCYSDNVRVTLLQWHCYSDTVTVTLLEWHSYSDTVRVTQLQWHCYTDTVTVTLLQWHS